MLTDTLLDFPPPTKVLPMSTSSIPVVFIPALLCDEQLYRAVIEDLGDTIDAHVLLSPLPRLEDSVADILARAPERFALVGTSYGGSLAMEIALAAPHRVSALWLMGCNPAAPQAGGPDLAGGLASTPDVVINMLAGLVVPAHAVEAAATFRAMAARVGGAAGSAQMQALSVRSEASSRLRTLAMPALVLWGQDDPLVPVAIGSQLATDLPGSHFVALQGCGHLPTLEQPAECAALFRSLLEKVTAH